MSTIKPRIFQKKPSNKRIQEALTLSSRSFFAITLFAITCKLTGSPQQPHLRFWAGPSAITSKILKEKPLTSISKNYKKKCWPSHHSEIDMKGPQSSHPKSWKQYRLIIVWKMYVNFFNESQAIILLDCVGLNYIGRNWSTLGFARLDWPKVDQTRLD